MSQIEHKFISIITDSIFPQLDSAPSLSWDSPIDKNEEILPSSFIENISVTVFSVLKVLSQVLSMEQHRLEDRIMLKALDKVAGRLRELYVVQLEQN